MGRDPVVKFIVSGVNISNALLEKITGAVTRVANKMLHRKEVMADGQGVDDDGSEFKFSIRTHFQQLTNGYLFMATIKCGKTVFDVTFTIKRFWQDWEQNESLRWHDTDITRRFQGLVRRFHTTPGYV